MTACSVSYYCFYTLTKVPELEEESADDGTITDVLASTGKVSDETATPEEEEKADEACEPSEEETASKDFFEPGTTKFFAACE